MSDFLFLWLPIALAIIGYQLYRWGVMVGQARERGRAEAKVKVAAERVVPRAEDESDESDVCLRPGQTVLCCLSDRTHTHGRIVGFAMGSDGMLAMVDLGGGAPLMPIDVDDVEPDSSARPDPGYRNNAKDLN